MLLSDLAYELPEDRIARVPSAEREAARLLVTGRDGSIAHASVRDLATLTPPALFVVNDSRVLPARLRATKVTGGRVEFLLVEPARDRTGVHPRGEVWLALGRSSKGFREGDVFGFGDVLRATIVGKRDRGWLEVALEAERGVLAALEQVGEVPLPPYMGRDATDADRERYQTVFAKEPGSVAAPTAGLHFGEALLEGLARGGHVRVAVTLHVGPGTFQPVSVPDLRDHVMHQEHYRISPEAADAIREAKAAGRPVIAVGTTVVRTLESAALPDGTIQAGPGTTDLLIQPPYAFRVVDGLVTNFHLPGSTLLALVMAFLGEDATRRAYATAIRDGYRFYSYGDAMFVPPEGARLGIEGGTAP